MPDPRPRKKVETVRDIASMARIYDRLAINTLAGVCRASTSDAARVAAANSILDRGHGKPDQVTELNAEIQITIRKLFEQPEPETIDVSPNKLTDKTK